MDKATAQKIDVGIALLKLVLEHGVPAYIKWQNGVTLRNPTLEDITKLHDLVPRD